MIRILTEERFVTPYPFEGEADIWRDDEPTSRSGYKKQRVRNYLRACATTWSLQLDRLKEAVKSQLITSGHQ